MKMLKVDIPLENSGNITNIASETIDLSAAHLIFSYLAHHCYSETATAFLAQWLGSVKESSAALSAPEILAAQTLQFRSHLRALLVDGRISEAIQYMEEFFPHLLGADDAMNDGNGSVNGNGGGSEDGSLLRFKLLCQQFVEMVRHGDSTLALEFIETTLTPLASNRPVLMKLLEEVIVLLAYSDPQDSPVQHLLAFRYREQLAETVNSAIIRQKNSSLELILKQLVLINLTGSDNTGQSESQEGIDLSLFLKDILAS